MILWRPLYMQKLYKADWSDKEEVHTDYWDIDHHDSYRRVILRLAEALAIVSS
jgi:hypothetical protein